VSGALWLCVPGRYGIAIWSPRLDKLGNSVRGIKVAQALLQRFPEMHMFGAAMRRAESIMSRAMNEMPEDLATYDYLLISAASKGRLDQVERLIDENGLDVDTPDYDGRTALHLALAEGASR
jgi:glutaminase